MFVFCKIGFSKLFHIFLDIKLVPSNNITNTERIGEKVYQLEGPYRRKLLLGFLSQQTHLTTPPFLAFFAKIRGAAVSPLPFFPIEKKRSFTGKTPKFFFAFGEIRAGQLGGFAVIELTDPSLFRRMRKFFSEFCL